MSNLAERILHSKNANWKDLLIVVTELRKFKSIALHALSSRLTSP